MRAARFLRDREQQCPPRRRPPAPSAPCGASDRATQSRSTPARNPTRQCAPGKALRPRQAVGPVAEQRDIRPVAAELGQIPRAVDVGDHLEQADDAGRQQQRHEYESARSCARHGRAARGRTAIQPAALRPRCARTTSGRHHGSSRCAHQSPEPPPSHVPCHVVVIQRVREPAIEAEQLDRAERRAASRRAARAGLARAGRGRLSCFHHWYSRSSRNCRWHGEGRQGSLTSNRQIVHKAALPATSVMGGMSWQPCLCATRSIARNVSVLGISTSIGRWPASSTTWSRARCRSTPRCSA